jgi:hypothetical protein
LPKSLAPRFGFSAEMIASEACILVTVSGPVIFNTNISWPSRLLGELFFQNWTLNHFSYIDDNSEVDVVLFFDCCYPQGRSIQLLAAVDAKSNIPRYDGHKGGLVERTGLGAYRPSGLKTRPQKKPSNYISSVRLRFPASSTLTQTAAVPPSGPGCFSHDSK